MLFDSVSFLIFFPIVAIVNFLLPPKYRPYWLLAASCYFYMSYIPAYILILTSLITLDFFLAQIIERSEKHKLLCLQISILANIGMLFVFKYFNFFNVNVTALAHFLNWNYSPLLLSIALPLGLSFHVFQSLSYVIEVYRGKFKAEKHYFIYALYVMFFPQLVAGPIERPAHLLPQLHAEHAWDEERTMRGLERIAWGLFKKLVIADNISLIVTYVFGTLPHQGPVLILVSILFVYELYCDFSGYCDIAVGSALILGYEIVENFDRPFAARSIAEFWRRWHISLSTWFRDYVFTPLALFFGRRTPSIGIYLALLISFTLMGLWHGANWTYITMGTLFGFYIVVEMIVKKPREAFYTFIGLTRVPQLLQTFEVIVTFLLVSVTDVFFRADTMQQALTIIGNYGDHLLQVFNFHYVHDYLLQSALGVERPQVLIIAVAIVLLEMIQYVQAKSGTLYIFKNHNQWFRFGALYVVVVLILFFGYLAPEPFIYFKF